MLGSHSWKELDKILSTFGVSYKYPTLLLSHENMITTFHLRADTDLVCVKKKPYRYPHHRKAELKVK